MKAAQIPQFDLFTPTVPLKTDAGRAYDTALETIRRQPVGTVAVYHTGNLPADRKAIPDVDGKAAAYMEAAQLGLVLLAQRRIGSERYEYVSRRSAATHQGGRA